MGKIDISDLNRAEVLLALYNASHVQGMGFLQAVDNYTIADARKDYYESPNKYFDYLHGRVLKVNLSGDEFDSDLFNRDCGPNAAEDAIDALRRSKSDAKIADRYTRKNFREVSAYYHDEDYPDYDMIDLLETYEKLKDDPKDQQYIITKEDLDFIMTMMIRDHEAEVFYSITDFIRSVKDLKEFNEKSNKDEDIKVYVATQVTLMNEVARCWMILEDYREKAVRKAGIYRILPYSFEDSYNKLIKDEPEDLGLSYQEVFEDTNGFIEKLYKQK